MSNQFELAQQGRGVGVAAAEVAKNVHRVTGAALGEDGVAEAVANLLERVGIVEPGFLEGGKGVGR